jgi:hypothetical protein
MEKELRGSVGIVSGPMRLTKKPTSDAMCLPKTCGGVTVCESKIPILPLRNLVAAVILHS